MFYPLPISSKGQITIPVKAREVLGVKSNSQVLLYLNEDAKEVYLMPKPLELEEIWREAKQRKSKTPGLSDKEMVRIAYEDRNIKI